LKSEAMAGYCIFSPNVRLVWDIGSGLRQVWRSGDGVPRKLLAGRYYTGASEASSIGECSGVKVVLNLDVMG